MGDLLDRCVLVYLDDILVYSPSDHAHDRDLRTVLSRLRSHKLYAKRSKCDFGKGEVEYLGHIVGGGCVRPDPSKTSAVKDWPAPTSVKQVQQFVGLANYYNRYIANFALKAAPLTDLLQKGVVWRWGPAEQDSFEALKTALTTAPVLTLADPALPYVIETDASLLAVGAVLMQQGRPVAYFSRKLHSAERNYSTTDRELLAIHLCTRRWRCYLHGATCTLFTDHEPLVNVQEQPALTPRRVRWVEQLQEFDLVIKHKPGRANVAADALSRPPTQATDVFDSADPDVCTVMTSWLQRNAPYLTYSSCITAAYAALQAQRTIAAVRCSSCGVLHLDEAQHATRKHVVHVCAACGSTFRVSPAIQGNPLQCFGLSLSGDGLRVVFSRLPSPAEQRSAVTLNSITVEPTFLARVSLAQQNAHDNEMRNLWAKGESQDARFVIRTKHDVQLLYRTLGGRSQLVIPATNGFRQLLLEELHCSGTSGHFGPQKTFAALEQRVWWPKMAAEVRRFIRGCAICQRAKTSTQSPAGLLQPVELPDGRFDVYSMDFITDLPLSSGCNALFNVVNKRTLSLRMMPCFVGEGQLTAPQVAKLFFNTIVRVYGLPKVVLHDRDPRFTSNFWRSLWDLMGVKVALSSAHHPQTDGSTERAHRTIEQTIRCVLADRCMGEHQWTDVVGVVELAINTATAAATGVAPAQLELGELPRLPVDLALERDAAAAAPASAALSRTFQDLIKVTRERMIEAKAKMAQNANKRRRDVQYSVGDKVLLDTRNLNLRGNRKLTDRFVGPFVITKLVGPVACKLDLAGRLKGVHNVFHVSLLKAYVAGGDGVTPPAPIVVDGHEEYEIDCIRAHRHRRGKPHREFLVSWTGHDRSEDMWLPEPELRHAREKLQQYWDAHR